MRILIVDDDFVSRTKMHAIIEDFGECVLVENGGGAITVFKAAWEKGLPFDLMTLDIVMPDIDGMEVLQSIRKIEEEKKVPDEKKIKIVMVTSQSEKEKIIECLKSGCDDYIVKPFNEETILTKLKKVTTKG